MNGDSYDVDGERSLDEPPADDELRRPTIDREAACECGCERFVAESPVWNLYCADCETPFAEIRWKTEISGLIYTLRS